MAPPISVDEVSRHNKQEDCWIVVEGQIYDLTSFAPEHPGGPGIIYKYAGRDATKVYNEVHSLSVIKEGLSASAHKGPLDTSTITTTWTEPLPSETPETVSTSSSTTAKPPLDSIINTHDFEIVARNTSTAKTWAFYSSASNDLITRDLNASIYQCVLLRPRTMRKVRTIDTSTQLFGHPISFPLFISPAAMARLIHPDGELAIARACRTRGIIQAISNNASYSATEIVSQPTVLNHPFIFQLYVDKRREKTNALLHRLQQHPNITTIMITVDAAAAGKREADERVKADETIVNPMQKTAPKNDKKGGGYGRLMASFIDPDLNWDYLGWLRSEIRPDIKLLLKGVMSADDVHLALQHGLDGVVLSNHGGRNLDTSPPPLLVLLELHARFPHVISAHHPRSPAVRAGRAKPFTILVDGGIRRGTDILKCVALGAVAVGIGRPALYAASYGQEGVEHCIDILREEFEVAMRNCGVDAVDGLGPELVNTGRIDGLVPRERGHGYAVTWRESRL